MEARRRFAHIRSHHTTHKRALNAAGIAVQELIGVIGLITGYDGNHDRAALIYRQTVDAALMKCALLEVQKRESADIESNLWFEFEEMTSRVVDYLMKTIHARSRVPLDFEGGMEPVEDLNRAKLYFSFVKSALVKAGCLFQGESEKLEAELESAVEGWITRNMCPAVREGLILLDESEPEVEMAGRMASELLENALYGCSEQTNTTWH